MEIWNAFFPQDMRRLLKKKLTVNSQHNQSEGLIPAEVWLGELPNKCDWIFISQNRATMKTQKENEVTVLSLKKKKALFWVENIKISCQIHTVIYPGRLKKKRHSFILFSHVSNECSHYWSWTYFGLVGVYKHQWISSFPEECLQTSKAQGQQDLHVSILLTGLRMVHCNEGASQQSLPHRHLLTHRPGV